MNGEAVEATVARPRDGVGHYLRDIVYGAIDGVVTTTAVIAGVAGASFEPQVAIVLGLANLVADGASMGASNYLGLKSELEQSGASVTLEQPWRHGLATTLAFMVAGAVPLAAYAPDGLSAELRVWVALFLAALMLCVVGAARATFVRRSPLRCAVEVLLIGGGASALAFGLGLLVEPLTR